MKTMFIGNPAANRGRAAARLEQLRIGIAEAGLQCDFRLSRSAEEVVSMSAEARNLGFDAVIACGGDGTVHHAAQPIVGSETALGLVPMGGGNDLAKALGFGMEMSELIRALRTGSCRRVDVIRAGDRYCCGIAGAGFDSRVNRRVNQRGSSLPGVWRYLEAAVRELRSFDPMRAVMEFDGQRIEEEAMFVVVANTPNYGGGLFIAPGAIDDDGLLDVVIVRKMSRSQLLLKLPAALKGALRPSEQLVYHRARRIRIETHPPAELYGDGEFIAPLPLDLEVVPRGIKILKL